MLAALCLTVIAPPAYTNLKLDGFNLVVESRLIKSRAQTWAAVRTELHRQLLGINRVIPRPALQKLNQVPIYIHNTSPETRCMAYHPGAQWLREHKMNPEMEKAIEIGSADNFLSWTQQQPWMVLHELAHAYHDRFLPRGFENPDLAAAHKRGLESKKYDAVLHWDGKTTGHYAKNNPMEFFAEASEAYFGQNDFYPFVNAELKTHDPETFALIAKVWGVAN
jgi:hypothetical protein